MEFWDPHFHIWDVSPRTSSGQDGRVLFAVRGQSVYDLAAYETDLASAGLEHTGGAFVEVVSVCHLPEDGWPYESACVAEAWWVSQQLERSPRPYRLVPTAPLESPRIRSVLHQLKQYPRVVGIRQILNHEPSWPRNERLGNLLEHPEWRAGFACLGALGLSFDLQLNPHQFAAAAAFLAQHPEVPVILNHLGCPTAHDLENRDAYWSGMKALAALPQVSLKLSMLAYPDPNWDAPNSPVPPLVHQLIELFGVERCCFASNFPVDLKDGWPAPRLFEGFRNLADAYSPEEQQALFAGNARRIYGATS